VKPRPVRILIAKPGLDGHDRGAKVLARALRDEGMEVIYTGLRQKIPMIVAAAIAEDVDVVGLSVMSGGAVEFADELKAQLDAAGSDAEILVGGTITKRESQALHRLGVQGVFPVGSRIEDILEYIRSRRDSRAQEST